MIPKIIHYCWFGGKSKPQNIINNIETWHRLLPDYKIIEWNENNFDVNKLHYTREAYFAKKYAFVSDVARIYAIVRFGGIYFDTDILLLKRIDDSFLSLTAFAGFENDIFIGTAVLGAEPNFFFYKNFYSVYEKINFFKGIRFNQIPNTFIFTELLVSKGLKRNNTKQKIQDIDIFPQVFFSAKYYSTGKTYNTEETITIHNFSNSWNTKESSIITKIKYRLKQLLVIIHYNLVRKNETIYK